MLDEKATASKRAQIAAAVSFFMLLLHYDFLTMPQISAFIVSIPDLTKV